MIYFLKVIVFFLVILVDSLSEFSIISDNRCYPDTEGRNETDPPNGSGSETLL